MASYRSTAQTYLHKTRFLFAFVFFSQLLVCASARADEIALPTPRNHYEQFKPGTTGLPLLFGLMKDLDPEKQKSLMTFVSGLANQNGISKQEALTQLKQINWSEWKPVFLEFILHQSKVLDMIPAKYRPFWTPIVHDSLLYFFSHLPQERLLQKVVDIAYLPEGSTTGNYYLAFISEAPSLQKVAQIVARNPALLPEYQMALEQFENGVHTISRDRLVQFITNDVGQSTIDNYQVQFGETILAEASVGAVIRASCIPPGSRQRVELVCKVIKPYALINLPQELEIINGLAEYFSREHEYYQLGSLPLPEMFRDIKKALIDEINVTNEQQNFKRAWEYYKDSKEIIVPKIYPISTEHVTFMEYTTGEKITDAFQNQPEKRAILAKRFFDVMTTDVIFAKNNVPLFHGDPHAGNVFHVTNDPKNPYRIALLDWGLYGTFPRKDRLALMQLILGVQLKDPKRLHKNVGVLLEHGMPDSPAKVQRIDAIIADVLQPPNRRSNFDALGELITGLVDEGYATNFNLNLFIKSQITISGILAELDPNLNQNKYLMHRAKSIVEKEFPKRLLYTIWFPAWNSHNFRSLISNKDLVDELKGPKKRKTATNVNPAPTQTQSQPAH